MDSTIVTRLEESLGGTESHEEEMEGINFKKEEKKSKPFKQDLDNEVDEELGNQYVTKEVLFWSTRFVCLKP